MTASRMTIGSTTGLRGAIGAGFLALAAKVGLPGTAMAQEPAVGDGMGADMAGADMAGDGLLPEFVPALDAAADLAVMGGHDLSPLGMFLMADIVVQAVMVGLVLASVVTWTVWIVKQVELALAGRRARQAGAIIARSRRLEHARRDLPHRKGPSWLLVDMATGELDQSAGLTDKESIKERAAWGFQRIEANAALAVGKGMGVLATIGSTAPFVGLFGTVWGIMNSFVGIAESQTTNLAVVAPGIAEALLATGLGLVAAIPAVMIYNSFARSIAAYRSLVADNAAHVLTIVSRELDLEEAEARRHHLQAAE